MHTVSSSIQGVEVTLNVIVNNRKPITGTMEEAARRRFGEVLCSLRREKQFPDRRDLARALKPAFSGMRMPELVRLIDDIELGHRTQAVTVGALEKIADAVGAKLILKHSAKPDLYDDYTPMTQLFHMGIIPSLKRN